MNPIPFINIHSHPFHKEKDTIVVQNIYPGDGFAEFTGRNFYSVGLHPWYISTPEENNNALQILEEALEFDHVIFVGEAGLDKLANTDFKEQQRVFEAQAYIAEEFQCPLVIHCVKAFNEVVELHKKMNPAMPWIMHAYNGSLEITKQLANSNIFFSFGENLYKTNSKAVKSFCYLPLGKIFFETDEFNGKVDEIYQQGANLKGISIDVLKKETWYNFNRLEKSLLGRF